MFFLKYFGIESAPAPELSERSQTLLRSAANAYTQSYGASIADAEELVHAGYAKLRRGRITLTPAGLHANNEHLRTLGVHYRWDDVPFASAEAILDAVAPHVTFKYAKITRFTDEMIKQYAELRSQVLADAQRKLLDYLESYSPGAGSTHEIRVEFEGAHTPSGIRWSLPCNTPREALAAGALVYGAIGEYNIIFAKPWDASSYGVTACNEHFMNREGPCWNWYPEKQLKAVEATRQVQSALQKIAAEIPSKECHIYDPVVGFR